MRFANITINHRPLHNQGLQKMTSARRSILFWTLAILVMATSSRLLATPAPLLNLQAQDELTDDQQPAAPDAPSENEAAVENDAAADPAAQQGQEDQQPVSSDVPADDSATSTANTNSDAGLFGKINQLLAPVDGFFGTVNRITGAVIFYPIPLGGGQEVPAGVVWLVLAASFLTLRMGFINLRAFGHAIKVTAGRYDDPSDAGEVSHFQALTAALSATVGLGNIAGVAVAVGIGGPGATFWMVVAGFLGMSSKFVECTLGQMYRQVRPDGRIMGGAMFYLSHGLKEMGLGPLGAFLGFLFAVLCIGGSFAGGNAFQVNQSLGAVGQTLPFVRDFPWVYGLIMSVLA